MKNILTHRETVLEEMNEILKLATNIHPNIENLEAMNRYSDKVRNMQTSIPLIEMGYIIRRNVPIVNKLFKETYNELLKHKLKRDQIVYPIVVTRTNFPVDKIKLCL